MRKIRYSKDVDALLIDLSDKQIDIAEGGGEWGHTLICDYIVDDWLTLGTSA